MSPLAQRLDAVGPTLVGGQHATKLGRSIYSGWVAAVLREAIIDGTLASGTPLVEARVADELAVSRGPVRSALQVLEGEGLVRTLPNGRTSVVGFGAEDLRDLFRVRFELESTAIRWAPRWMRSKSRVRRRRGSSSSTSRCTARSSSAAEAASSSRRGRPSRP
jgi:DNA-binding GntR family transcriptional regulator